MTFFLQPAPGLTQKDPATPDVTGDIGLKSLRLYRNEPASFMIRGILDLKASGFILISGFVKMPEASTSNIHGPIHGGLVVFLVNTGGVEEDQENKYSSLYSMPCSFSNLINSSL